MSHAQKGTGAIFETDPKIGSALAGKNVSSRGHCKNLAQFLGTFLC